MRKNLRDTAVSLAVLCICGALLLSALGFVPTLNETRHTGLVTSTSADSTSTTFSDIDSGDTFDGPYSSCLICNLDDADDMGVWVNRTSNVALTLGELDTPTSCYQTENITVTALYISTASASGFGANSSYFVECQR